ncbi:ABC transporter substrate-binding protein [Rhodococcus oxybenzonivorans]|uniref:ABC transporter substrate-binding protein n=1 Tax=Rhodococcus oxybenzonivorans TaxID=1990687 RepID=UPI002952DB75|nr:ABC transporter substrate-binding protein [Rhodococcus oxybenzonivorans]MDV7352764.1 ABC transporter substrate-binding protein [Rhodococcus oxybenzonivorans]
MMRLWTRLGSIRRNPRHRTEASVLAALAVSLLISACGTGTSAEGDSQEIDRSGVLRVAGNVVPNNLDPHQSGNYTVDFPFLSPVYDRLTQVVSGPEIVPMLAEGWTFAEDGKSVDFRLRNDAVFHSGNPVDAEAVVASLDRSRDPQRSKVAARFAMVESVQAVDDRTVRIAVTRPALDLPSVLSTTEAAIVDMQAIAGGLDITREGAGSGPYTFDQVRPGDRITYLRNEGYWDPEAQKPARLELVGMPDDNSRLNAFRSGQVDAIKVDPDQYDELQSIVKQPGFELHEYPTVQSYVIYLDIGTPGLEDKRVRQALNYAIDRESINTGLLNGRCPPLTQPLPEGVDGHNGAASNRYPYDPDRARQLLREAGAPENLPVRVIYVASASPQQEMATAIQAQMREVGVDAQLMPIPAVDAQSTFRTGNYGLFNLFLASPLPGQTLMSNYLADFRFPTPPSPEFTETVMRSLDPSISDDERTQLYSKASGIAAEEAYAVFVCGAPTMVAYSTDTVGMNTLGHADFTSVVDVRYAGVTS